MKKFLVPFDDYSTLTISYGLKPEINTFLDSNVIVKKETTDDGETKYILEGSRVVIEDSQYFHVFDSIEDYTKWVLGASKPCHFFSGYNRFENGFSESTATLIKELLTDLNKSNDTNLDVVLLHEIDSLISNMEDPYYFYQTHILGLIAIVGEIVIEKTGCSWKIKEVEKGVWMPFLIFNQIEYDIFTDTLLVIEKYERYEFEYTAQYCIIKFSED